MNEKIYETLLDEAIRHVADQRGCSPSMLLVCRTGFLTCSEDPCPDVRWKYRKLQVAQSMPPATGDLGSILPADNKARLDYPMAEGLLYYFPAALAEVARVSKIGNDQHNPGEPLHWARTKSTDHEDKILRHLTEAGTKDGEGVRHSARLAWRALALLQVELEREEGAPPPRNAKF